MAEFFQNRNNKEQSFFPQINKSWVIAGSALVGIYMALGVEILGVLQSVENARKLSGKYREVTAACPKPREVYALLEANPSESVVDDFVSLGYAVRLNYDLGQYKAYVEQKAKNYQDEGADVTAYPVERPIMNGIVMQCRVHIKIPFQHSKDGF